MIAGLTLDVAAHAIAAALLHSLWQGAVIAVVTATALRALRRAKPPRRSTSSRARALWRWSARSGSPLPRM